MEKHTEEVDLFYVFKKFKNVYLSWLARGYQSVQFFKKYWIILTIMIVGGYLGGKFWQNSERPKHQAVMIVQNNFESSSYVYEAIETLNRNCQQFDKEFLTKIGLSPESLEILDIVIEPVISVKDLLKVSQPNDRNIDTYISQIDIEDDLLVSEIFYPQYQYHKITLTTSTPNYELLDKILDYLNSNKAFNDIKQVIVKETELQLARNNETIAAIDALFAEYSGQNDREVLKRSDIIMKIGDNDLAKLVSEKTRLIRLNQEMKKELTKYGSVVFMVNNPNFVMMADIWSKKSVLIPLTLVVLFVGFFWLKSLYLKGKKYASAA